MPNKDYSNVHWSFDEQKSDWDNTLNLIKAIGYNPRDTSLESLVACILLHWEGECENEHRDIPLKDYLVNGILHGESGRPEDFDYE